MTPESQRIAIAEACGWVHPVDLRENGITQDGSQWWTKGDNKLTRNLPDYLNDLNAMHEAEKKLSEHDFWAYCDHLEILTNSNTGEVVRRFEFVHASAAQRSEAFLRTLGLWKD